MNYHWEWVSSGQAVLYEEGHGYSGTDSAEGVAAAINTLPVAADRPEPVYRVTSPLVDKHLDFPSFEEAKLAVEAVIYREGGAVVVLE